MFDQKPKKRTDKFVFIIESDEVRQNEIQEAISHQTTWKIEFFNNADACLESLWKSPMIIFLDIEHFTQINSDEKAVTLISILKKKTPRSEIIVFCDSEKEHEAALALKKGALDYIVLNKHAYAKMENELLWVERVLDQRVEDRKQMAFIIKVMSILILFLVALLLLNYFGILKESSDSDILIGD